MSRTLAPHTRQRLLGFAPAFTVLAGLLFALCFLLMSVAQAARPNVDWRIAIRNAAIVQGDVVRLGEIASPVGNIEKEQWKTLADAELWRAPRDTGEQTNISRTKLTNLLEYYLEDLAELCIIPGRLVVQRGGRVVQKQEIVQGIVESLTPSLKALPGESSLRDFRVPDYALLSDSQNRLEFEVTGKLEPGRISILIKEVALDGRLQRKFTGTAFVDSWRSVACAAHPLNSRESLTPQNVTFARKNVAFLRGEPWDGKTFGMRVMRPVGAGQVIYADILDDVPVISKGDKVSLIYEGKNIQLGVVAKALEDGRFGQSIIVRNLESKREVTGVVRDGGTVVVR